MPPRPQDVTARARAVRQVFSWLKDSRVPILGLAPEGGDNPDGSICRPAPGAGRFGLLLAASGLRFFPVGAYEENGGFCMHFGPGYELKPVGTMSALEKDRLAADEIMQHIARLLPRSLRGEFG